MLPQLCRPRETGSIPAHCPGLWRMGRYDIRVNPITSRRGLVTRRSKYVLVALVTMALCSTVVSRVSTAGGRVALTGSTPSWATRANLAGSATDQTVVFRVYLPWQDGNAAANYAL